jgi:hypothetical protein
MPWSQLLRCDVVGPGLITMMNLFKNPLLVVLYSGRYPKGSSMYVVLCCSLNCSGVPVDTFLYPSLSWMIS